MQAEGPPDSSDHAVSAGSILDATPEESVRTPLAAPLGITPPASKQDGGPTPDTTDWRRYFPLEVGNRWQYLATDQYGESYYGWSIDRDTTIEGEEYVIVEYCTEYGCSDEGRNRGLIRYDAQHSYIAHRIQVPEDSYDTWWDEAPCALDAPFDTQVECGGRASNNYFTFGGPGYTVVVESDTLRDQTYKLFDSLPYVTEVVSGLGIISQRYPVARPDAYDYLVYARVGGVEFGEQAFAFPTSEEDRPRRDSPAFSVGPNPTRGRAVVTLAGGPAARVEVFDAVGRRVRTVDVAPSGSERLVSLDMGALALGVYAVTATLSDQAPVVRLLTIIR